MKMESNYMGIDDFLKEFGITTPMSLSKIACRIDCLRQLIHPDYDAQTIHQALIQIEELAAQGKTIIGHVSKE